MDRLLSFFLPAQFVLLDVLGLAALVVVALSFKRSAPVGSQDVSPDLTAAKGHVRPHRFKHDYLWFAVVALAIGSLGTWASGISFAWTDNPAREWSDGGAPEWEPIIRKHAARFINEGKSVGVAVAVASRTKATIMTFGSPSLRSETQTRDNTLFEIGSITKTFTAIELARQIELGMVRLEQPVQELLPSGVALPAAARAITLRHLTTHTSGLPWNPQDISLYTGLGSAFFGADYFHDYTEANLHTALRSVTLEFEPGTKFGYSNYGMMLLGSVLARNAGTSYEALIKREIAAPLAMGDTVLTLDGEQKKRFAQGYRDLLRLGPLTIGLHASPSFNVPDMGGAGAIRSSVADMLKYLQMNMRLDDTTLGRAARLSHAELYRQSDDLSFGMNWFRVAAFNPVLFHEVSHGGDTIGYSSELSFTQDGGFGIVILSNSRPQSVHEMGRLLLRDVVAHGNSQAR